VAKGGLQITYTAAIVRRKYEPEARGAMMTNEQQHVFEQAVLRGLVKNSKAAYEAGAAALRRQLQELKDEEKVKLAAAQRAEAEAIARNQFTLFPQREAHGG
jgi:hypothetical protein